MPWLTPKGAVEASYSGEGRGHPKGPLAWSDGCCDADLTLSLERLRVWGLRGKPSCS